ncbi:glycosyltransferase family 10, partial [Acinetobacter baumannii]
KWDTLADYKYHIAIENDSCDDWVTEKFFDPILAYSYPFYYGCPNIHKYISEKSFTRIDINNFNQSIEIIESIIGNDSIYNNFIDNSKIYRDV